MKKERIIRYIERHRTEGGVIYVTEIMIGAGVSPEKIHEVLEEEYPQFYHPPKEGYLDFN